MLRTYAKIVYIGVVIAFFAISLNAVVTTDVHARLTIGQAGNVLDKTAEPTGIEKEDVTEVLARVIKTLLSIAGLIFFILMVYGGMVWMTAQGNDDRVEKGRKIVTQAVIGIAIMAASFGATNFIQKRVVEQQTSRSSEEKARTKLDEGPGVCCKDWTSSEAGRDADAALFDSPNYGCRVTTAADCEFQGSHVDRYDRHACPNSGPGCWMYKEGFEVGNENDIQRCLDLCSNLENS